MNCQDLLDLLHDYIGGDLVLEQQQTIELHLIGCSTCVLQVKSYRYTMRLARSLPKCTLLPKAVEDRLREALAPHFSERMKDEG
jgi:hypothetical protein